MMTTDTTPQPACTTICAVSFHTAVPLLWFACLVFAVPSFAAFLGDIWNGSMRLPLPTILVLNISAFIAGSWYIYFFLLVPLIAMDAAIYSRLIVSRGRPSARTWSIFILAAQAVITLLLAIAICLPLTRIT